MHKLISVVLGFLAAVTLLPACGSSSSSDDSGAGGIATYVAAVTSSDGSLSATLRAGSPPSGGGDVTTATVSGAMIPGGTTTVAVSAGADFDRVIVAVDGVSGYYELTGLSASAAQSILVSVAQGVPADFTLAVAAGTGTSLGSYQEIDVTLTLVGTGDVQVNVTWDAAVDVDLHVLDPDSEEIYYSNDNSVSGGELDLDSNPGCNIDGTNAENITWATGTAPSGTYKVLVDYYSACVSGTVNYVVTVHSAGQASQTFAGSFTESDADHGYQCFDTSSDTLYCGRLITTFTR